MADRSGKHFYFGAAIANGKRSQGEIYRGFTQGRILALFPGSVERSRLAIANGKIFPSISEISTEETVVT